MVYIKAYLKLGDFNVITVDWRSLAEYPNYARAALSTTPVGIYVANFLDFLISQGTPSTSFHVIGYSLGAHIAGSAGNSLRLGRIPRITGLEPASGGYERMEKLRSLSSTDANFVDVIHTNANILGLGTASPIGHADFYPNGGRWQYGCLWNTEYDSLSKIFYNFCLEGTLTCIYSSSLQSRSFNTLFHRVHLGWPPKILVITMSQLL